MSTLYDRIAKGTFPKPIKISDRAVAFDMEELLRWQLDKLATHNGLTGAARERWIAEETDRELAKQSRIDAENLAHERRREPRPRIKLAEAATR
jgi:hypothetical protein